MIYTYIHIVLATVRRTRRREKLDLNLEVDVRRRLVCKTEEDSAPKLAALQLLHECSVPVNMFYVMHGVCGH
jgi:hypothetical protein